MKNLNSKKQEKIMRTMQVHNEDGSVDVFEYEFNPEAVKQEYNDLFKQWKELKKSQDFPFCQFTDETFKDIKRFLKNEYLIELKAPQYLKEIREIHFTGKLTSGFVEYLKML